LYDVKDVNPNGDPLEENKPRIDEETGINVVSDVRLKRTIRDYLDSIGELIFIKEVRRDGLIDLSLQPIGKSSDDIAVKKILEVLESNDNNLPLNYKSDPLDIQRYFGLSKKAYKRALTKLIEDKKIEIGDGIKKI